MSVVQFECVSCRYESGLPALPKKCPMCRWEVQAPSARYDSVFAGIDRSAAPRRMDEPRVFVRMGDAFNQPAARVTAVDLVNGTITMSYDAGNDSWGVDSSTPRSESNRNDTPASTNGNSTNGASGASADGVGDGGISARVSAWANLVSAPFRCNIPGCYVCNPSLRASAGGYLPF